MRHLHVNRIMNREKRTYLVTGGAGFIGANFVKYLLATFPRESMRVIVLDALTYAGNVQTLAAEIDRGDIIFIKGDINDWQITNDIFAKYAPDYVVNFAAESHVDRSIDNPRIFIETNVLGTQNLLETCRKWWKNEVSGKTEKRFLQVSTDEVYGALQRDFEVPKELILSEEQLKIAKDRKGVITYGESLFTEKTPLSPRSPYSASKAAADMLVQAYGETFGIPVLITRCSNNYGPYQFPEKLIPLVINNLKEGRSIPVYGEGKNVRDWLYVADHVSAIDKVLRQGKVGEVYNIGGLNEQENISIVKTIIEIYAELTDSEPRHDLITYVKDRPGHDMRYAIDASKTARDLGWLPSVNFADGIKETVRWYIDNYPWIENIVKGDYREYYNKMYENR